MYATSGGGSNTDSGNPHKYKMNGCPIRQIYHGLCNNAVSLEAEIPSREDRVVVVFPDKGRGGSGIASTSEYSTHVIPVDPNDAIYDFDWHDARDIEFSSKVMSQPDSNRIVIVSPKPFAESSHHIPTSELSHDESNELAMPDCSSC